MMSLSTTEHSNNGSAPPPETLSESVQRAVYDLPNVDGAFLFDLEGETLVAAGSEATNDAAVLALVNGLIQLAERTATDLGRGALQHLAVQGQLGYVVATILDSSHSLVLLGSHEARLGLLMHDLEWLAMRLAPSLD